MKRSTDRILTTHVGSLVKPDDLQEMINAREARRAYDAAALGRAIASAIGEVVRKQAEVGIDIVNDGEFSKSSWGAYFRGRLTNVESRPGQRSTPRRHLGRDERVFPEWFEGARAGGGPTAFSYVCVRDRGTKDGPLRASRARSAPGPVKYVGQEEVQTDIANLKAAAKASTWSRA